MPSMYHACTIEKVQSGSCLPPLPENANWWQKFRRHCRKHILVSDKDPRIIEYYRTVSGLMDEKRRHNESKYSYMIHPFSDFNNIHESGIFFVFLFCFLLIPHTITYGRAEMLDLNTKNIILTLANIYCQIDIIRRFFTGYIEENLKFAVLDQRKVAKHYMLGPYFIFDVISSLPTDIVGYLNPDSITLQYLHMLRVFKLVRIMTFLNCFVTTAFFSQWNKFILKVFRYLTTVILIVHWFTCFNSFGKQMYKIYVGTCEKFSHAKNIENCGLQHFVVSLFETSGLLLCAYNHIEDDFRATVDHLERQPNASEIREKRYYESYPQQVPIERIVEGLVSTIFGKTCTAFFAVIVVSRIFEFYTLETKYESIMNQLHEYMKNKKLPMAMRDRLVQYYEHRYQKKYFKEGVITDILSENLRTELNINVCKQLVHIVKLFAELPPNILSKILSHLKAEVYLPNDLIIKAGTVGDCMYFLASGTVSVYTPSGREICHLQDGAYFGEVSLILKNTKRTTDIIAVEVCEVYRLDKKAFQACFKYEKYGVYEKMQELAEQRLKKTAVLEETYKLELFQKAYTEKQ